MRNKEKATKHITFTHLITGICMIVCIICTIGCCIMTTSAKSANQETNSDQTSSIPVILNHDGTIWIDQNGNPMEEEAVKDFLANNSDYAWEILYLNGNPYYATNLQNGMRTAKLDQLWEKYITARINQESRARDEATCYTIVNALIADPPTETAFTKLRIHLRNNGAIRDVENLQNACHLTNEENDSISEHQLTQYIFFWALAENYDSGYLDKACGEPIMKTTSPQIPVLLSSDNKTWLDQNGCMMDEEVARFFFIQNKGYAREILQYNRNQYYLDTWQSDAREKAIGKLWEDLQLASSKCENCLSYEWIMYDMANNPPSLEMLKAYQDKLGPNFASQAIAEFVDYINNGKGLTTYNQEKYIFWYAVAKATESGVFETTF